MTWPTVVFILGVGAELIAVLGILAWASVQK